MSEILMAEHRKLLREILEHQPDIQQAWLGPRSNEVGYRDEKGHEVSLTLRVREVV